MEDDGIRWLWDRRRKRLLVALAKKLCPHISMDDPKNLAKFERMLTSDIETTRRMWDAFYEEHPTQEVGVR